MSKEFKGVDHGYDIIDLRPLGDAFQMKPVEIHLKQNGAFDSNGKDTPSLTIVMTHPETISVIGQISVAMFNEGLADIGYKLVEL